MQCEKTLWRHYGLSYFSLSSTQKRKHKKSFPFYSICINFFLSFNVIEREGRRTRAVSVSEKRNKNLRCENETFTSWHVCKLLLAGYLTVEELFYVSGYVDHFASLLETIKVNDWFDTQKCLFCALTTFHQQILHFLNESLDVSTSNLSLQY